VQKPKLLVIRPNYTPTLEEVNRSFDRGTLRVIRKGGKPQQIPLNPEALACIEEEVKFRTERFGTEPSADQPLFTNRYGRRYNKIRGSLKPACEKAKVPYITHHSLRHFFANALKDQKLDIGEIRDSSATPIRPSLRTFISTGETKLGMAGRGKSKFCGLESKSGKKVQNPKNGLFAYRVKSLVINQPGWRNWQTHRT
jgi:hypothetical protein